MNWKSIFSSPFVVVIGLVVAFLTGRMSSPTKTVEVEKKVEIHHEAQVIHQKVDFEELKRVVASIQQKNNVVREKTIVINPDGSSTTTEKETDRTETASNTDSSSSTRGSSETDVKIWKETVRVEEHVKLVENLKTPDTWSVGVLAGANLPHLLDGDVPNYVPGLPDRLVVGVAVDRQLLGPVRGGLWANSRGDAGLVVRLGF